MGDANTVAEPRRVQRLTRDGPGVATVNIRSSQIIVCWASHDLLVPVDIGWYLHAASVAGRASVVDGERRLDAAFDLADSSVRWQHAKIGRVGCAELFLEKDRRYLFYITRDQATPDGLRRQHLPWPFQFRPPKKLGEPAVIAFQSWPYDLDFHRPENLQGDAQSPRATAHNDWLLSFDSWEHDSLAEVPASDGRSVKSMLSLWALYGMIEGGAMVDARGPFVGWTFWCPNEDTATDPTNPYGLDPSNLKTNLATDAEWHYVIPERQQDGSKWTSDALKSAIQEGNAVALTAGQVVMLGGDLYEKPENMWFDGDRWKSQAERISESMNIMKVYWEARLWVAHQRASVAQGGAPWQHYLQRYGVVYLVFELLMSTPEKLQDTDTVDEMELVAVRTFPDRQAKLPDDKWLLEPFDRLMARAKKVDAMVDLLIKARGPSRFSEMHLFAQTLGSAANRTGTTLGWMKATLPWLNELLDKTGEYRMWFDPRAYLKDAGFTQDEITMYDKEGIDDMLLQIVASNGRFAALAEENQPHFSDGGRNAQAYLELQKKALDRVTHHMPVGIARHPIPDRAIFLAAFGCHFLTDAFSASHMRVPRTHKEVGPLSAKLMHDVDGLVGLWVYAGSPPQIWYAFGDTYLHPKNLNDKQRRLLPPSVDPKLNFDFATAAVGSTFKALQYYAHSFWQSRPQIPPASSLSAALQKVLAANGPTDDRGSNLSAADLGKATTLRFADTGPGTAGPPDRTMWDHLQLTVDQRIAFLKTLVPRPLPPGDKAATTTPTGIDQHVNLPPLLIVDANGTVTVNSGPYDIVVGGTAEMSFTKDDVEKHYARGFTKYAGFSLRVYWGPFGDLWDDNDELRLNFDKYYFMTKFFKDVHGMEKFVDKTLLDIFDKLPKEKL